MLQAVSNYIDFSESSYSKMWSLPGGYLWNNIWETNVLELNDYGSKLQCHFCDSFFSDELSQFLLESILQIFVVLKVSFVKKSKVFPTREILLTKYNCIGASQR